MKEKKELAKSQGLNWQAFLIEEAQTDLKILIRDEVLKNSSIKDIIKKVDLFIKNVVDELELESLKESTLKGLTAFASRLYVYFKNTFKNLNLLQITSFVAIINNVASISQIEIANQAFKGLLPTAYERRVPLDIFAKDYMSSVNERLDYIAKIQAKEDYTSKITLRNYAEMQIRQEAQQKALEDFKDKNVELIWIVPHANASKRCSPWQGKLYSLNGTYGIIDGERYQPLENATDIYEVTKEGKVYKNGIISGFNCRHKMIAYKKGNKPIEIPSKIVKREREINDKQRYFEKGIRLWKEQALLNKGIDNRRYVYAREKAKEWNTRYIKYSQDNNVAYYPSRKNI